MRGITTTLVVLVGLALLVRATPTTNKKEGEVAKKSVAIASKKVGVVGQEHHDTERKGPQLFVREPKSYRGNWGSPNIQINPRPEWRPQQQRFRVIPQRARDDDEDDDDDEEEDDTDDSEEDDEEQDEESVEFDTPSWDYLFPAEESNADEYTRLAYQRSNYPQRGNRRPIVIQGEGQGQGQGPPARRNYVQPGAYIVSEGPGHKYQGHGQRPNQRFISLGEGRARSEWNWGPERGRKAYPEPPRWYNFEEDGPPPPSSSSSRYNWNWSPRPNWNQKQVRIVPTNRRNWNGGGGGGGKNGQGPSWDEKEPSWGKQRRINNWSRQQHGPPTQKFGYY